MWADQHIQKTNAKHRLFGEFDSELGREQVLSWQVSLGYDSLMHPTLSGGRLTGADSEPTFSPDSVETRGQILCFESSPSCPYYY